MPNALGVKVTLKVQLAWEPRVAEHGFGPPGEAAYSPLPATVGLREVGRLLVRVTVCGALVVATVCGGKVRVVGAKVRGRLAVPVVLSVCWLVAALSVMMTAPLITPLAPTAGVKVTPSAHVAAGARLRLDAHGFKPEPAAEKPPVVAMLVRVTELALLFLTVRAFAALAVPTT